MSLGSVLLGAGQVTFLSYFLFCRSTTHDIGVSQSPVSRRVRRVCWRAAIKPVDFFAATTTPLPLEYIGRALLLGVVDVLCREESLHSCNTAVKICYVYILRPSFTRFTRCFTSSFYFQTFLYVQSLSFRKSPSFFVSPTPSSPYPRCKQNHDTDDRSLRRRLTSRSAR